jgi:hypothetical protein
VAAYDGAFTVYENAKYGWDLSEIRRNRAAAMAELQRRREQA